MCVHGVGLLGGAAVAARQWRAQPLRTAPRGQPLARGTAIATAAAAGALLSHDGERVGGLGRLTALELDSLGGDQWQCAHVEDARAVGRVVTNEREQGLERRHHRRAAALGALALPRGARQCYSRVHLGRDRVLGPRRHHRLRVLAVHSER